MRSIWKFPFPVTGRQSLTLPKGSVILHIEVQRETPCLWAMVDVDQKESETRVLRIYGTGHPLNFPIERLKHLNSIMLDGGSLVFHVFEELE